MNAQEIIKQLIAFGLSQSQIANSTPLTQGRISQILKDGGDCTFESGKALEALLLKTQAETEPKEEASA